MLVVAGRDCCILPRSSARVVPHAGPGPLCFGGVLQGVRDLRGDLCCELWVDGLGDGRWALEESEGFVCVPPP